MPPSEPWTVGRLLQWTTDYFRQQGRESPRLDAEVLLAHVRGCERIQLYTAFDELPDDEQRERFRELVKRRAAGTPVGYLVGHREFFSLSFEVNQQVLIPRPETEHLVTELLDRVKEWRPHGEPLSIIDVGTGSGAIAICAARHLPEARVTAVDVSPAALAVATRNAARLGVADRVTLLESDLLSALPADQTFDFIVSNPPYVSEAEFAELDTEVRDHEPRQALVAGPTGTEVIQRLVEQAGGHLRPGGWLLFEISPMIAQAVLELIARHGGGFQTPSVVKDLAGHARVVQVQRTT